MTNIKESFIAVPQSTRGARSGDGTPDSARGLSRAIVSKYLLEWFCPLHPAWDPNCESPGRHHKERYFSPPETVLTSYSSCPFVSSSCEAESDGTAPTGVLWATIHTPIMIPSSRLALPNDKTITISVISGRSKGLAHRLTKPKNSIGNTGSGANIEIDDPQVSSLHCAVGVTEDTVRLCDLDSANGTYVNDERVQATNLEHLSEFCVGSTVLLVTILPKRSTDISESK